MAVWVLSVTVRSVVELWPEYFLSHRSGFYIGEINHVAGRELGCNRSGGLR
jgi:hypothetical protein